MNFSGNIEFADEGSWLTLTTDSDESVTISVTIGRSRLGASNEVLNFTVSPNAGVVRLPAGEILRALSGSGSSILSGSLKAVQGDKSCSYAFSVLPCRKFAYKNLAATIFTTRPTQSSVFRGTTDRLYYFQTSGTATPYVRFRLGGNVSGSFSLTSTYNISTRLYDLDVSCDTMLSMAASKGLNASAVTGYDIWIECAGDKSETYSFTVRQAAIPLKSYKFLGARGTYEYIHATGSFGRSVESETQVFVNSGIEQELKNDASPRFEQNSGHIAGIGASDYWLQFLASRERYIIEKDGSERLIIVDEFKTSLTDLNVGSLTFTWHYANPNNTTIERQDIPLTGLAVTGPGSVNDESNSAQFGVTYSPANTTQRGVAWSIASGSAYASIDAAGKLTVKSGAASNTVTVRATSSADSSVYADKGVTVTYKQKADPVPDPEPDPEPEAYEAFAGSDGTFILADGGSFNVLKEN